MRIDQHHQQHHQQLQHQHQQQGQLSLDGCGCAKKRTIPGASGGPTHHSAPAPKRQRRTADSPKPTSAAAAAGAVGPTPAHAHASNIGSPSLGAALPVAEMEARFSISQEVLGSGQFGCVRACFDRRTGEPLACKSMRKAPAPAPAPASAPAPSCATWQGQDAAASAAQDDKRLETQMEDVRREASVMARLAGQSGVVQLRGLYEGDQEVHLVMERCEGGDLFDEIVRRQRFSEPEAAHVFRQIACAVAACHERGIFHRDIKPENILLARQQQPHQGQQGQAQAHHPAGECSSSGRRRGATQNPHSRRKPCTAGSRKAGSCSPVGSPRGSGTSRSAQGAGSPPLQAKLADFGLALELHKGEKLVGTAGSPFYMAPEVLQGEHDFKADVWSLGVILYILLSGAPPFWGATDAETYSEILHGEVDFACHPWGAVSEEAKGLVRSLLEKDPGRRPDARHVAAHPWVQQGQGVEAAAQGRPGGAAAKAQGVKNNGGGGSGASCTAQLQAWMNSSQGVNFNAAFVA